MKQIVILLVMLAIVISASAQKIIYTKSFKSDIGYFSPDEVRADLSIIVDSLKNGKFIKIIELTADQFESMKKEKESNDTIKVFIERIQLQKTGGFCYMDFFGPGDGPTLKTIAAGNFIELRSKLSSITSISNLFK